VAAIGAEELDFLVPELLPVTVKLAFALGARHPEDLGHGVFPLDIAPNSKSRTRIVISSTARNLS
jgi:hypothetical protein